MKAHPRVNHPKEAIGKELSAINEWVTTHLSIALGSVFGVYLALIIPLMALPIPAFAKIVVIISSNWIQLWALFVLQRSANKGEALRNAKADTDHEALTYIAHAVDLIASRDGLPREAKP